MKPNSTQTPRKKPLKDVLRICAVAAFFVAAGVILNNHSVREQLFNIDNLRRELQSSGLHGLGIFILAAIVINALGIPRIWVAAVAGSLFGAIDGICIGLVATIAASSLNFVMGRSLLRGPIRRNMPRRLKKWYKAFNNHGFRAILYLRLFPLTNATLTNLLGGASEMRFKDYIMATIIGYVPFTVVFAMLGSSAAKQNSWQLIGGLVLFAALAIGQWTWSRRQKRNGSISDERAVMSNKTLETSAGKEAKL